MKIVIAGGSGQIGTFLARHFGAQGDSVVVLSRTGCSSKPDLVSNSNSTASTRSAVDTHRCTIAQWNGETLGQWMQELDGADVLFDVAVIDWELPGLSGVEICSRYRKAGGPVPILMLTGRSSIDDKIEGFESGADDYLPKPFNPAELFARVRALLRRAPALRSDQIVIGDLELDTAKGTVKRGDQNVKVTKTEYAILEVLMKNPGRIFTGEELIERIWGAASDCTEISLRSHIARLRAKFEAINTGRPLPLKNVYGMGYKVEEV